MASQQLVALGINTPTAAPDALGSYQQGAQAQQTEQNNQIANAAKTAEILGAGSLYALNGDINGEVDPAKYNEVLDSFQKMGLPVDKYRDNPNYAKVFANASVSYMQRAQLAQNAQDHELLLKKFDYDVKQGAEQLDLQKQQLGLQRQKVANETALVGAGEGDAAAIGDAIISGDQPPNTTGLYKVGPKVRAYLAKQGFDMTKADQDYKATYRLLQSMNGPQQLRLRQAISTLSDSLPMVEQLVNEWDGSGLKALNSTELAAAKQGLLGQKAQSIAARLESQIKDVTAELANVYMGGNSPTEQALKLAGENLKSDWDAQTLRDAIKLAKENIRYRQNSLNQPVAGISDTQYNPSASGPPPAPAPVDDSQYDIQEVNP